VEHVEMTLIAVVVGFVIAFTAALLVHRFRSGEVFFANLSSVFYTIPSIAFFQIMVPITGIGWTTIEIALISYTLLILFRNTLTGLHGVPPETLDAAEGMGLTRRQMLTRVELPLAMPAIIAGVRVATVTTISLATVAAFITPLGLGAPIFSAIQTGANTDFIAAGLLAILLALIADLAIVLVNRLLSPWQRARAATS
jgi:osmoprotectant transport system permease protein